MCSILVCMTPNHPDSTVAGQDEIGDNSRHERSEDLAGGEIIALETLDIAAIPSSPCPMNLWPTLRVKLWGDG